MPLCHLNVPGVIKGLPTVHGVGIPTPGLVGIFGRSGLSEAQAGFRRWHYWQAARDPARVTQSLRTVTPKAPFPERIFPWFCNLSTS
eukprot:1471187-Rhodomonas_salina.1